TRGEPPREASGAPYWADYAERNQLFLNDGQGHFRDLSPGNPDFCAGYAVSRGLLWGDFDNDGRVDLIVTAIAAPARFYRNIAQPKGHWLLVRALDPALHRDA